MNEQLILKVRACPNLPTLPAIAMQVLELTQKENVDVAEIARLISKDPALSGKILKTVNSSFYGRSHNISTISHSLVILGLQSVKTLVLGFSLVSNLTKNKAKGFKHIIYWKRSIFAATAARSIAAKISLVQQEEAFLAALLMDIGMLVLDLVICDEYGLINEKVKSHGELAGVEASTLGMTHADVGGLIAEQWKLPPLLTTPIARHHSAEQMTDPTLKKLTEVVGLAGRIADVFVDEEPAAAIAEVRKFCQDNYKLAEADCDALLADIGKKTKEVATLFEINLGPNAAYDSILSKAREAVEQMTLAAQAQNSNLQQQNQVLHKQATTDALTGLNNRAEFDKFLQETFAKSVASQQPMALLMLDLDKFKSINDTRGHPAGDQVLRAVGKLLKSAARPTDLSARYGGEEMALIMSNTTRQAAAAMAETLRRAIGARPVPHDGAQIPVTASIGVSLWEPGSPFTQPSQLIKAADLALYNAKQTGRNCVRVFSLKPKAAAA